MLVALCLIAFGLRFGAGLLRGPNFVEEGYSFYAVLARTFLDGGGLCYDPGVDCTIRMPLYPVLVSPFVAADAAYPWLIALQAAVDAGVVWLTFGTGALLFNTRVGLAAAAGTAFNPYAVMHASAFQETTVFNALIALAVYLLIRSWQSTRRVHFVCAGAALGLAMLTTVRLLLFLPLVVGWLLFADRRARPRTRVMGAALVVLPIALLLGGWAMRNQRVIGSPVLSTEAGLSLWIATRPETMQVLPQQSIDVVEEQAFQRLPVQQQRTILALERDPAAQDRYYAGLAWDVIAANPGAALLGAFQRMIYGFAGWLSPAREWPIQFAYACVFLPLNVLAVIGLWRARHAGGPHGLVVLLFASFLVTAGIFWAHTSHRAFLHPFEFIYAASALVSPRSRLYVDRFAPSRYPAE